MAGQRSTPRSCFRVWSPSWVPLNGICLCLHLQRLGDVYSWGEGSPVATLYPFSYHELWLPNKISNGFILIILLIYLLSFVFSEHRIVREKNPCARLKESWSSWPGFPHYFIKAAARGRPRRMFSLDVPDLLTSFPAKAL